MKINYFLLAGIIIFCLWSCGKDDINSGPSNSLVKTLFHTFADSSEYKATFTYDNQNRLKLIKSSTGDSVVLEYFYKLVSWKEFDSLGELTSTNLFYLNIKGLVDSALIGGNNTSYKMSYDINGYPSIKKYFDQNGELSTDYYTILNGNTILIESKDLTGILYRSQAFGYNFNTLNSLDNKNYGQSYLGKFSANIRSKIFGEDGNGNQISEVDYTYEFDSRGRISKILSKSGSKYNSTTFITYY